MGDLIRQKQRNKNVTEWLNTLELDKEGEMWYTVVMITFEVL
jgi:hypothetical protein